MAASDAPERSSMDQTVGPSERTVENVGLSDTARRAADETIAPSNPPDRLLSETIDLVDPAKAAPQVTVDLPKGPMGFNATIDSIPSLASSKGGASPQVPRPEIE